MTLPVYLVDDDDAVRKALILLLSTVNIKAKGFADPVAFLSQLAALEPGCLILDIRMPAITGLKLQEKLTEEGIDWPVIIISGHGNIEACRRAFHNGAVDFLSSRSTNRISLTRSRKRTGYWPARLTQKRCRRRIWRSCRC